MNLVTNRQLIARVASRWKAQYFHGGTWGTTHSGNAKDVYDQLATLDPTSATADQVSKIIGNESWSNYFCLECNEYVAAAIEIDAGDGSNYMCEKCTKLAGALFDDFQSPRNREP